MNEVKSADRVCVPKNLIEWVRTAKEDGSELMYEARVGSFLLRVRWTGSDKPWDALVFADGVQDDTDRSSVEQVLVCWAINFISSRIAMMKAEALLSTLLKPALEVARDAERERAQLVEQVEQLKQQLAAVYGGLTHASESGVEAIKQATAAERAGCESVVRELCDRVQIEIDTTHPTGAALDRLVAARTVLATAQDAIRARGKGGAK